jgi:hypothetical protein
MPQEKLDNFMEGFKKADIEKSAKLDIKPKLEIEGLGIKNGVDVQILTEPYKVQLPEGKGLSKDDKIWMVDVMYMDVIHQFIAQAGSFRYQLLVLVEKHFESNMANVIGEFVKIWKESVVLDKWGESILYKVELIE